MTKVGGGRQYLVIDLATEQWEVRLIPGFTFEKYLGGEALGLYLWSQHVVLDKPVAGQPLCITLGALSGSGVSCSSTLSIIGRSPASNLVESSTAISSFSHAMVSCGWQAIILQGVARRQMTLHITPDSVDFRPSEKLIGKYTGETLDQLHEDSDTAVICIGPAGENAVPFAALVSEETTLDRHGFGSNLGQKHIKAIVLSSGSVAYSPFNVQEFEKVSAEIKNVLDKSRYVKAYSKSGPLQLMEIARMKGFAAVEGLTKRTDPRMFHLGGSECARKFALEVATCGECTLCCKRYVMRPGGQDLPLPNTLEMMALGSNIGNYDPMLVMQWRVQCIELGLDPIAAGVVIGSLMSENRDNDDDESLQLSYGDTERIPKIIDMIGHQAGYGMTLANRATDSQVHGRVMTPFDPRGAWGQALFTGMREDFPLIPELIFPWLPTVSMRAKAEWVVIQENLLAMMRSIGMCDDFIIPLLFEGRGNNLKAFILSKMSYWPSKAKSLIDLELIAAIVSHFTGVGSTAGNILDVGRRAVSLKRKINGIEGYPANIPQRFMIDPQSNHQQSVTIPFKQMAARYQLMRTLDLGEIEEE
jgi:aldehyde:ferredoxin oxidoreductase